MTTPTTGWYPDPGDPSRERWWDAGTGQWLEHTRPHTNTPGSNSPSTTAPEGSGPAASFGTPPIPPSRRSASKTRRRVLIGVATAFGLIVLIGVIGSLGDTSTEEDTAKSTTASAGQRPSATTQTTSASARTAAPVAPPATTPKPPSTSRSTPPPPPPYPGARKNDAVADRRGAVEVRGLTVILGPLQRIPADGYFEGPRLCSDLTLQNQSTDTQYYDGSDFSVQYPSGDEKGTVLVYDGDVGTGNLVAGGRTSGRLCFIDRGEAGQHLVLWNRTDNSSFTTPRRGVWLLPVTG